MMTLCAHTYIHTHAGGEYALMHAWVGARLQAHHCRQGVCTCGSKVQSGIRVLAFVNARLLVPAFAMTATFAEGCTRKANLMSPPQLSDDCWTRSFFFLVLLKWQAVDIGGRRMSSQGSGALAISNTVAPQVSGAVYL